MTIAPYSDNPEDSRAIFARTAELFADMRTAGVGGSHCNVLSMGMSGDFEVAIEEGANIVRIGRALFGPGDPGSALEGRAADDHRAVAAEDDEEGREADADAEMEETAGEMAEFAEPAEPDEAEEGPKSAAARKRPPGPRKNRPGPHRSRKPQRRGGQRVVSSFERLAVDCRSTFVVRQVKRGSSIRR